MARELKVGQEIRLRAFVEATSDINPLVAVKIRRFGDDGFVRGSIPLTEVVEPADEEAGS